MKKSFSKKRIAVLALSLLLAFSLCACGDNNALSPKTLVGTWQLTKGSLEFLNSSDEVAGLEIYRGGTAKGICDRGREDGFTWEIAENDADIVHITYRTGDVEVFTLEKDGDGNLELRSMDDTIILKKVK